MRVFKTAKFSKDAKKTRIADADLCAAMQEIMAGLADDLGGGVFKKRLNNNQHRAIILAKSGPYWIYEFLFAKKDRSNITADELSAFRLLAKSYARVTEEQVRQLVTQQYWIEICHDHQS
nr:type II toxin-antitoxin system RelE/ParE family toxin [uncultured Albidiferax sp.]